jgi:hydroxymethylglutaryl-CoA reductase
MRDTLIADMKLSNTVQSQMNKPLTFCRAYANKVAAVEAGRTGRAHVVTGSRF